MPKKVKWLEEPIPENYPKAADYLRLLVNDHAVEATSLALEAAPITFHKAKDILRAAGLQLLTAENPHVARYLKLIREGGRLAPVRFTGWGVDPRGVSVGYLITDGVSQQPGCLNRRS